jgi:hypothetical protein
MNSHVTCIHILNCQRNGIIYQSHSDLEGVLSEGCCHLRSRALALLFGAVVCIVVVLLLDGESSD